MRIFGFLILFAIIGLAFGYGIYGKIGNEYVDPGKLFASQAGISGFVANNLYGLEGRRNNILIAGGIGAIVGLFVGILTKNKDKSKQ